MEKAGFTEVEIFEETEIPDIFLEIEDTFIEIERNAYLYWKNELKKLFFP